LKRAGTGDVCVLQEYLDKLIVECDRKISRASKRLEEDDAEAKSYPPISKVIRTDETDAISVVLKEKTDRLNDDSTPRRSASTCTPFEARQVRSVGAHGLRPSHCGWAC
jgi:Ran GTPase-activating protein (RanGAP) involved in mRNA processing and transport